MKNNEKDGQFEELKKEIVIERLRQAPPTIKVSFGAGGEFLERDKLIEEVKKDTEIGKKIVNLQFAYLKALKKGLLIDSYQK